MAFEAADEIGGNERVAAAGRLPGDKVAKAGKRHGGSAALIDQRRHATFDAHHVGFEAETPGDVAVDVRMGVDHSRQNQLAADIDDLPRSRRENVLADQSDLSACDGNIHHPVDA
jgi:hypothetical protein